MIYLGKTGEVTLIPRGEKCDVEWKMHFASLSEEDDAWYYSPDFYFEGESWFFGMSPNGSKSLNSNGYIHLRIWKYCSSVPPINVEFCFSLKSVNGEKDFRKQSTGVFEGRSYHEIARFLSRDVFEKRKSEFLSSDGFFTVVCTLKRLKDTGSAISECSYCQKNVVAENISVHEKKCMDRPIKCPECSEVVLLRKWHDHECLTSGAEGDSSLCEDFNKMLLEGFNSDLILKVGDKELRAHQCVLRARSKVFKSILSHDKKEKNSGIIEIPDCDPHAMEQFLCYLYSGKVDSLDSNNMLKLYYIADKYDKKGLKEICSAFIMKSLSITNICQVIQLALNHTDYRLLEHATEYFIDNALDIMCTVEWQSFMKENCTVANKLTIKSLKKFKNANT